MSLSVGGFLWGTSAEEFPSTRGRTRRGRLQSFRPGDRRPLSTAHGVCVIAEATKTAQVEPLVPNNDSRHPSALAREAVGFSELSVSHGELDLAFAGYESGFR